MDLGSAQSVMDRKRNVSQKNSAIKVFQSIQNLTFSCTDTIPWSSPTIRELNEVQNVLKAALEAVQSETTTVPGSESEST